MCAAVEGHVEETQSPPASHAGVQHGRLHVSSFSLVQLIVVSDLDADGLVTHDARQLDVGGVRHVEVAVKVNRSDAGAGSKSEYRIKGDLLGQVCLEVSHEVVAIHLGLEVVVLKEGAPGEARHLRDGGHVDVRVGEEEDVDRTTCCHTLLPQLCVEVVLWSQQRLYSG